jgi:hypothetical protein
LRGSLPCGERASRPQSPGILPGDQNAQFSSLVDRLILGRRARRPATAGGTPALHKAAHDAYGLQYASGLILLTTDAVLPALITYSEVP